MITYDMEEASFFNYDEDIKNRLIRVNFICNEMNRKSPTKFLEGRVALY